MIGGSLALGGVCSPGLRAWIGRLPSLGVGSRGIMGPRWSDQVHMRKSWVFIRHSTLAKTRRQKIKHSRGSNTCVQSSSRKALRNSSQIFFIHLLGHKAGYRILMSPGDIYYCTVVRHFRAQGTWRSCRVSSSGRNASTKQTQNAFCHDLPSKAVVQLRA